jgi:hypothetical protein
LTPDSIQQKYAQTVASTWITPSCLQFLGEKKRFHTAWTHFGHGPRFLTVVLSGYLNRTCDRL